MTSALKALKMETELWRDFKTTQSLNVAAPRFVPQYFFAPVNPPPVIEDLARYLACRDLVNTSRFQFDDRPETYRAWQSSFNNAVRGLGLTASIC